ncbi:MAG: HAMP domain-containing sensor histidine kinase [Clostridiaceae bacterium]
MDWIDEKIQQVKDKLRITSLKKTLGVYIFIAIVAVVIAYITTEVFCEGWRELIYQRYDIAYNNGLTITNSINLNSADSKLISLIEIVEKGSILIYSTIAICVTSHTFFKDRLQEPVNLLIEEAKHIGRDDLSFVCQYESGDEMGDICSAFDKMRVQLYKNKENMWNMMEGQRRLKAAFAHDIRTPLTVIQGYTEILEKYYPQGKISEEKLLETMKLIQTQVTRLRNFSETMKKIDTFESMEIKRNKKNFDILDGQIKETVSGLQGAHGIIIDVHNKLPQKEAFFDEGVILQVLDNLLSNALSYTHSHIDILLENEDHKLYLYIRDDGRGFSNEDLYMASMPYYSSRTDSNEHFGIGLTICKLLCEKHGGNLNLSNSTRGGAIVCASFFIL